VGFFFTPLDLPAAFDLYDKKTSLSSRRFVAPSFNDVRHILNIAQVLQIRRTGKLVTFDGDQTLYEDGGNFAQDSPLVSDLIQLINKGIRVALVTAAGYPGQPERYEGRLAGLLAEMTARELDEEVASRFFVVGGECNYLFRCSWKAGPDGTRRCGLIEVAASVWRPMRACA
jgi:IMP and pyridine-specific 5'-nucleotidase